MPAVVTMERMRERMWNSMLRSCIQSGQMTVLSEEAEGMDWAYLG